MSLRYWFVPTEDAAARRGREGERFNVFDAARTDLPLFQRALVEKAMQTPDRLRVHYDPANPARSVLSRGMAMETIYLAFLWVPLSLLVLHCWRYVSAVAFVERAWDGLWSPAARWVTRTAIAMAALGSVAFIPLYALAWTWGTSVPAEALGLVLLVFLVALAFPSMVAVAFRIRAVQMLFLTAMLAFVLGSLVVSVGAGYRGHRRVEAGESQGVSVRYAPSFENIAWAMRTEVPELHGWALDELRRHPQGEKQIPIVRQGLKSADRGTRMTAARTLTTMNASEVNPLVGDFALLLESDDEDVLRTALFVVEEWAGDPARVACDPQNHCRPDPRAAWPLHFEPLMAPLLRLRNHSDRGTSGHADRLLRHIAIARRPGR